MRIFIKELVLEGGKEHGGLPQIAAFFLTFPEKWGEFMQEFDDLKAQVTKVATDMTEAVTALAAKDATIADLNAQIVALKAVEAIAPADIQAQTDALKAAAAPLEAAVAPATAAG